MYSQMDYWMNWIKMLKLTKNWGLPQRDGVLFEEKKQNNSLSQIIICTIIYWAWIGFDFLIFGCFTIKIDHTFIPKIWQITFRRCIFAFCANKSLFNVSGINFNTHRDWNLWRLISKCHTTPHICWIAFSIHTRL